MPSSRAPAAGLRAMGNRQPSKKFFEGVQEFDEQHAHNGRQDPQDEVEDQLPGTIEGIGRQGEGRLISQERPGDDAGRDGRDDHAAHISQAELAQDDLQRKENPCNRGIESCGDACGGAAGDQIPNALFRKMQELADGRPEGSPHLDNRALTPGRATTSDAGGRGEDLGQGDPGPDAAAFQRHGLHDFRHAMPLGLACKEGDDWAGDEGAQHRRNNQPAPSQLRQHCRSPAVEQVLDPLDGVRSGTRRPGRCQVQPRPLCRT